MKYSSWKRIYVRILYLGVRIFRCRPGFWQHITHYRHTSPKKAWCRIYFLYSPTIYSMTVRRRSLNSDIFGKRKKLCIYTQQEGNLFGTQRQTMRVLFYVYKRYVMYNLGGIFHPVECTTNNQPCIYLLVVFNFYCVCWHFHQHDRDVINAHTCTYA